MRLTKGAFRCKINKYDIVIMQKVYKTKRHIFMKRKNNKLLTLMLAGVLCAATAGTVAATLPLDASADTTAQSYALNTVFNTNSTASAIAGKNGKTALTFGNEDSVEYDRNIAIKWFESKGVAKYMTLKFTFEDVNFTEMAFAFEAAPMQATKEDTSVNTIKFVKAEDNKVSVKVINGDEDETLVTAYETAIVAGSTITLSLADTADLGSYQVNLAVGDAAAENVGTFTNVGAKYFNSDDMESLVISAKTASDAKTVLFVENINGQDFNNVSEDNKVTDGAAPVLVVNEDIKGFLLGAQFELDYKEIDVLDSTITSDTAKTYYQYNPADTKAEYTSKLLSSTYFMDTVLYVNEAGTEYSKTAKDGFTKTSVFREWEKKNNAANNGKGGEEFVSIRFTLKDDTYKGEATDTHPQNVIDLAWYAESDALAAFTLDGTETDYIVLNRSTAGPAYTAWTEADVTEYETKLAKKAEKVYAGSNAEIELPSVDWLIKDENNGYQSLQFTISYKTPSSSSAKTSSNLDADDLEISASEAGWYEFKIFASDVAGNAMYVDKLDKDGKVVEDDNGEPIKVKVTTSNVWDLDNVPSFLYEVKARGIKTADNEDNDTLDTQILGETYTMTAIDIVGATTEKSDYALYALNLGAYDGTGTITTDKLSGIKFAALKTEMDKLIADELAKEGMTADKVDFMELSKQAYVNLVAKAIGGEAASVAKIFTPIAEYNDRITEENETAWAESDNKYNWKATSRSFKAVDSGLYLIVADYWDDEMLFTEHAPAYQLVEVASEADVIKGETEWLKNNLVSVILFSIAAVMLILIIILLLVKPSDETLEDIDEKVVAKRKQATDKHKKN